MAITFTGELAHYGFSLAAVHTQREKHLLMMNVGTERSRGGHTQGLASHECVETRDTASSRLEQGATQE
jgi:hypothetical protein